MALSSVRRLGEQRFSSEGARLLLAGNALHADFAPESAGSGVFGLIMTMLAQTVGFPAPLGGAGELTRALARRLESLGGRVQTSAEVADVVVRSGRAVGVRLADGTEVDAGRAVLASVTAPALYGRLVAAEHLPDRVRRGLRRFVWDPSTVKVDWALSAEVPVDGRPRQVARHDPHRSLGGGAQQLLRPDRRAGRPVRPVPARRADDEHRRHPLPGRDRVDVGVLPRAARNPGRCRRRAVSAGPGTTTTSSGTPTGCSAGSSGSRPGSATSSSLDACSDRTSWRRAMPTSTAVPSTEGRPTSASRSCSGPIPGLGRAETPVRGLYLASASAHPGGGVHGAPGANAARAALFRERVRRRA